MGFYLFLVNGHVRGMVETLALVKRAAQYLEGDENLLVWHVVQNLEDSDVVWEARGASGLFTAAYIGPLPRVMEREELN